MIARTVRLLYRGKVLAAYPITIASDDRRELVRIAVENAHEEGLLADVNLSELQFMVLPDEEPTQRLAKVLTPAEARVLKSPMKKKPP